MISENQLNQAVETVNNGGIIVYPTESVYGLGCNPFDQKSVEKLLLLKKRNVDKGLILIASHVQHILPLIKPIEANDLSRALKTWPGHHTWVFPKSKIVPYWVSGKYESIAVRVSKNPIVIELCQNLNSPLISTSANISTENELCSISDIKSVFGNQVDFYLDAPTGKESKPSTIHDAHTNTIIR
jgi:L-threonylcarbamoyladenylate synthase